MTKACVGYAIYDTRLNKLKDDVLSRDLSVVRHWMHTGIADKTCYKIVRITEVEDVREEDTV